MRVIEQFPLVRGHEPPVFPLGLRTAHLHIRTVVEQETHNACRSFPPTAISMKPLFAAKCSKVLPLLSYLRRSVLLSSNSRTTSGPVSTLQCSKSDKWGNFHRHFRGSPPRIYKKPRDVRGLLQSKNENIQYQRSASPAAFFHEFTSAPRSSGHFPISLAVCSIRIPKQYVGCSSQRKNPVCPLSEIPHSRPCSTQYLVAWR